MTKNTPTALNAQTDTGKPERLPYFTPKIEPGIPIPHEKTVRERTKEARIRWPFREMNVGDSVLLPKWAEPSRASAAVAKWQREEMLPRTYKICIRSTEDGYRVWRVE